MKTLIKFRTTTSQLFVLFALGGLALSPKVSASGGPPSNCNTSEGYQALFNVTTGFDDTAFGGRALYSDTSGSDNTAVGCGALVGNTTGNHNTATGSQALSRNTSADDNTANGYQALYNNTGGIVNTAVGFQALFSNTGGPLLGYGNTAIGASALAVNTTGALNTAIGFYALGSNTVGWSNVALGTSAGTNVTTATDVICIGDLVRGANVSHTWFVGNIFETADLPDALPVVVNVEGQLVTFASAQRFKRDVRPMDKTSEAILTLKPVTFHYKNNAKGTPQFGLIAEDVAQVNPDLAVHDKNGEILSVHYDQINAMLLNEFLKEHKKVEEQEATITQLKKDFQVASAKQQKEIQLLTAQVKDQAAQIQKVSAQIEISRSTPQVVTNKP